MILKVYLWKKNNFKSVIEFILKTLFNRFEIFEKNNW